MKSVSILLAILFAAPALLHADYQITLHGGTSYRTRQKPTEKNGAYVFTATDGTLLSVRKKDVASVRRAAEPAAERTLPPVGNTSPVEAARQQQELARTLRENHRNRPANVPQDSDAYRPGVGMPLPAGSNDYVVGKTWAPPPSGTVYSGPAPTGVSSGDAPKGAPSMDAPKGAPSVDAVPSPPRRAPRSTQPPAPPAPPPSASR